jgi:hypothetical protein
MVQRATSSRPLAASAPSSIRTSVMAGYSIADVFT